VPVLAVWFVVVGFSGYVGLATMSAGLAAPAYLFVSGQSVNRPVLSLAVAMALFLIYTHRENIQRLKAGSEARLDRLMIFQRRS
jgi:glycerol-3-phosphate acyltransferase PlsY